MGVFRIHADSFWWINGMAEDLDDLCLHGHVTAQIGQVVLEEDCTVSAAALYLLKTLEMDKLPGDEIQMLPCCGHFMIANGDLSEVTILGCSNGTDWSVVHEHEGVRLTLPSGESEWVSMQDYRDAVIRFADQVEAYYHSRQPKNMPEHAFERNGYAAFWNEWHHRYTDAVKQQNIEGA